MANIQNNTKNPLKILVTGGAGFIGTNLVKRLTDIGEAVTIIDTKLPKDTCGIQNMHIVLGDIRDSELVDETFRKGNFDVVIHLASVSRVIDAEQNPELCKDVGLNGTRNILDAAEKYGMPNIIYGSSREVYGEPSELPVKESYGIHPINIYGEIKAECEDMVRFYQEKCHSPSLVLRFSNVYGSWLDHKSRVTPLFIRNILEGKQVTINGGGQLFDFTHVEDTVEGIMRAIDAVRSGTVTFDDVHILTGEHHSLQELISYIEEATGKKADIAYNAARSYDVEKFYGDPAKAEKLLGFKAKISLEEGVKKFVTHLLNKPIRILKVIHGYPPYYMAGSEVYSYQLANELAARGISVGLFTRVENPFIPGYTSDYAVEKGVLIKRVNNTSSDYVLTDKYLNPKIDESFEEFLTEYEPDIVHVGHLSHLSTNIPLIAKKHNIPVIMTIHDFWMYCFRGQMIDSAGKVCPKQCEKNCMVCLEKRLKKHADVEDYRTYREHMEKVLDSIDYFIAPSKHVMNFYITMGMGAEKITHLRYGFDKERITFLKRTFNKGDNIRFGFTGRIIPVKGIQTVIDAFGMVRSDTATLKIYGDAGKYAKYLDSGDSRLGIEGPYHADDIDNVLKQIDVLVVPSEWFEVSPLVIQEAILAGIPVITSDLGGMPELIQEGGNGFLIPPGDKKYLANLMQKIVDDPTVLNSLDIDTSVVVSVEDHVDTVMKIYKRFAE